MAPPLVLKHRILSRTANMSEVEAERKDKHEGKGKRREWSKEVSQPVKDPLTR
jgi:hypothetical protein